MADVQEITFPSGKKAQYLFATTEILESASQLDEIAELADFALRGPLTEAMPENSPRYREFLLSRYLLLQLLKHFKRENVRNVAFSLAHTKGAALVAGYENIAAQGVALAQGLGVDLEAVTRRISPAAAQRITLEPQEKKISPLHLWCLKEAAFKAHPHNQRPDDGLLLSDFVVREAQQLVCLRSQRSFETYILSTESFHLVFASCLQ